MRFLTPAVQSTCFFIALIVYGCFSSPTPDSLGLPECMIALLLIVSMRFAPFQKEEAFFYSVLAYGLTIPVMTGLMHAQNLGDMIRDVIPFLYLLLPLFFGAVVRYDAQKFLYGLTLVGVLFALRTIYSYQSVLWTPALWGNGPPADLLYLANSPEVLFSALFSVGFGGLLLMTKGKCLYGIALMLIASFPMIAMVLLMQRAGVGALITFVCFLIALTLYYRPKWGGLFGMIALTLMVIGWNIIEIVLASIWQKTEIVGLNARAQEWATVLEFISQDALTFLFGAGWGGRIENPAVGGLSVNYTHSLISSLLLKTGLVGTFIIMAGCFWTVFSGLKRLISEKSAFPYIVIGAALMPLMISVFLYASYKSLGFGLILCVFLIFPIRKLEKIQ